MPIIVSEIKIAPGEPKEKAFEKAFSVLKIKSSEATSVSVSKISVDARKISNGNNLLYSKKAPEYENTELKLIPYSVFANRGESDMTVWLRRQ